MSIMFLQVKGERIKKHESTTGVGHNELSHMKQCDCLMMD